MPTTSVAFVVLDASTMTVLAAREPGRYASAKAEVDNYANGGSDFYAPNTIVPEVLFALCRKHADGVLTPAEYAQAVQSFRVWMSAVLPPPTGEASLILRAEQIRAGYGCSRSADSLYLALAEELGRTGPTALLTFDAGLPNHAARNAPTVNVHLL